MSIALSAALVGGITAGLTQPAAAAPGDLAHGVVIVDSNKNNAVDTGPTGANDTPLAGVTVTLRGTTADHPGWTTTTAADGTWAFPADADRSASPGPFTVTINAAGVNGNAYLAPETATPGVNDFVRSGAGTQQAISQAIPANATDVTLNALVYPTWSTDVIPAADPKGYQGKSILTGTEPFSTTNADAPGNDAGTADDRVRTGDLVNMNWSVTANAEQDLDASFTAWFEQTIHLGEGAVANFGQLSDLCGPASTITALPSGDTIDVRVDPPADTESVVLKCDLGPMGEASAVKLVDSQIYVSGSSGNGATFTTSVRTYGATADGVTTARPDGPEEFGPFKVSASPRYDLEKQRPFAWQLGTKTVNVAGVPTVMRGYEISYSVTLTTDRSRGNEAMAQPVVFEDSLWGLSTDGTGTQKNDFNWYMMYCGPDGDANGGNLSVGPGGTTPYGKVGNKLFGGGTTTTENAVVDSGACDYTRTGDQHHGNYTITLSGIDTSGSSYPTKSQNGTPLPADKFYVGAYTFRVFIPYDEIDAMDGIPGNTAGAVNIYNRVGGFDPVGLSGAPNYAGSGGQEPGYCDAGPNTDRNTKCDLMPSTNKASNNVSGPVKIEITPGNSGKQLVDQRMTWNFRTANLPYSNGNNDGQAQVQPGQTFTSVVNAKPNLDMTDIQMCDVWDGSMLKLQELRMDRPNDPADSSWPIPAGIYAAMVTTTPTNGEIDRSKMLAFQNNWTFRYAHVDLSGDNPNTGVYDAANSRFEGNWTQQVKAASGATIACGSPSVTWYANPADVPGGVDAVNAVWSVSKAGFVQPGQTQLQLLTALQQRNTYYGGPHAGQEIPAYTIAANFGNLKSSTYGGGGWVMQNHNYIPGAGTTSNGTWKGMRSSALGDRWTLVRASMSIKKLTVAGTVGGEAATGAADVDQSGSAKAGTPVIWQINPTLSAIESPAAPVTNVTVTDVLPADAIYDAEGTQELGTPMPTRVTVNPDRTTTLVWELGTRIPNEPIGPLKVATRVDPLVPNKTNLINKVNIKADGIPAVENLHNDTHTVVVSQPGSLQLKKAVDQVLDLQNDTQAYTLQMRNFSETLEIAAPTVIEVLPHIGDGTNPAQVNRNPASKFDGTSRLTAAPKAFQFNGTTPATGTFYYTTIDPTKVSQDLNVNQDSIWSEVFTPDATAFKFVADQPLASVEKLAASGLQITFRTTQSDNEAGNLYANRFTAFSSTLKSSDGKYQLLTSNQVLVRVVGFSLGDLIWFDLDNNGAFDPTIDTAAPEGVTVNVYRADGTLVGTTTTNKDGRWVLNDLPTGDYYAEIPASQFGAGGKLAGYTVQTVGYVADPNTDANEGSDHNGAAQADGSVRTQPIHLSATVKGSTITGDEPMNDNTGRLTVTPGTTDGFTNFTLDMALKAPPAYEFTKTANPATGTPVTAGDTVAYTLTGRNTGKTPLAVEITDDLAKVLEFSTLTSGPAATIAGLTGVPAPVLTGTDLAWNGTLQPGQTVQVTYTVTVADGHEGGTLANHAASTATPPHDPPLTPPDRVTEHPIPGYAFAKSSDPASGTAVEPGMSITYTLKGDNTGATPLDPVVITDDLSKVLDNAEVTVDPVATIAGATDVPQPTISGQKLTWNGSLAVGQSVVITYTVTLNDDAAGVVVNNHAESSATPPGLPPITPPPGETEHPTPKYEFAKSAAPASETPVPVGGTIAYTLTGVNSGMTRLDPVVISDDLTEVLQFADVTLAPVATIEGETDVPQPTISGQSLTWTGSLEIGQSVTITYTVQVKAGAEGETLRNRATSEATPPGLPPITPPPGETEHPVPGYTFAKSASPASETPVPVGGTIDYTLLGSNTGATALDPVVVTDDLAEVLAFATLTEGSLTAQIVKDGVATDAAVQPTLDGTTVAWTGRLEIGESVRIGYQVTVNEGSEGETLRNHAESSATPPGIPPITPPPGETEHPVPGYTFTKASDPESGTAVKPGGTITYTLTGTNTGATVLDPVVVTDDLSEVLANAALTVDPVASVEGRDDVPQPTVDGTTVTWEGDLDIGQAVVITYTVTLNDDAEGVIVRNRATSSATPPGLPPITPPKVETWHPTPGYTFNKTADPASGNTVVAGDTIAYTLTGSNFGQTVLEPVVITDDLTNVVAHATLQGVPVATIVTEDGQAEADVQPTLDGTTLTWSGTLQIGEQVVITYRVVVNEGQEGAIVNNHASSTATPPGLPPITPPGVVTEHPVPGYAFDKTADPATGATVNVGDTITYTLTGSNTGATVLDPVTVTDDLSEVVAFADLQGEPTATIVDGDGETTEAAAPQIEDGTLTWSGALQVGEQVRISYSVKVKEGAAGAVITNRAHSEATPPGKPPVTPPGVTTEHPVPGYVLTKTADPASGSTVERGATIAYTVTGTNTGATALDPVRVRDDLSKVLNQATLTGAPSAVIVGADGSEVAAAAPVVDGTVLTWDGRLEVGQKVVITYSVKVDTDADATTINNRVESSATPPGSPEITPPPVETEHVVPPAAPGPRPELPNVGSNVTVGLLALALLVLAGGGYLVARGRRRTDG